MYPRKVGKQAAERAWAVALRNGADPAELTSCARRFAGRLDGTDPKFICRAATWLSEHRWCDDLVDAIKVDLPRKIT